MGFVFNSSVVSSIFWYLPVFSSKCRYLPVNAIGMENTHICRHFANLDQTKVNAQTSFDWAGWKCHPAVLIFFNNLVWTFHNFIVPFLYA